MTTKNAVPGTLENFLRVKNALTQEMIDADMSDLYNVGPDKPLGYRLLYEIECLFDLKLEDVVDECERRGNQCVIEVLWWNDGGALYVWNEEALSKHLKDNEVILKIHGLSTKCEKFIHDLATETYYKPDDLYRVIGLAFADPRFSKTP